MKPYLLNFYFGTVEMGYRLVYAENEEAAKDKLEKSLRLNEQVKRMLDAGSHLEIYNQTIE
jgi:hypothetical protein